MHTLLRDGVRLAYEEAGNQSAPALVFVHGWTCNRSHFAPQVERFSSRYRCISLDLRGHGESDAPQQEYTIEAFAEDAAWSCDELQVPEAVFVGHSMGGAVVLALSQQRPDLVRALALLDPAILFPPDVRQLADQLASAFAAEGGMETLRQFEDQQFFIASSDTTLRRTLVDAACCTPQHVVASAFRHVIMFDAAPALEALQAPLLYIGAEPQIADIACLRQLAPRALVGNTVGSGHFHQLEVPEQINAMLARFLDVAG
jgi:pimeloyl-ACP methyl ester carboxylesterase